jgi:rubredoxin
MSQDKTKQKWECEICGYIYDPALGMPEDGIAPGTPFEDIPDTWACPDCGASKEDFIPLEG